MSGFRKLGTFLPTAEIQAKIDARIAQDERKRQHGVETYGWSPLCACVECGDLGINVETQSVCWCDAGRKAQVEHERLTTWQKIVPELQQHYTLDAHPNQRLARQVKQWVDQVDKKNPRGPNLILTGPVGCVAGDTIIDGPDGAEEIAALARHGQPFRVWSLDGSDVVPAWSTGAFVKGVADLYTVTLDDGKSITATGNHLFLTPDGWTRLDQIGVGSLLGCDATPIHSTSAHVPSMSLAGGGRSMGTLQDSQWSYAHDHCRCDARPLAVRDTVPNDPPSQGGAHERIRVGCNVGGRGGESVHTHPYQPYGHPASDGCGAPVALPDSSMEYRHGSSRYESLWHSLQSAPLSLRGSSQIHTFLGSNQSADRGASLPLQYLSPYEFRTVVNCSYHSTTEYYDMHVPHYENYRAHGIWNHNTGKTGVAVAALRPFVMAGTFCIYGTVPTILDQLRPRRQGEDHSELRISMDRICNAGVLVLDDLGTEKQGEWPAERLTMIFDERHKRNKPTIITTNLPARQWKDAVGERIESRMTAGATILLAGGDDLRKNMTLLKGGKA